MVVRESKARNLGVILFSIFSAIVALYAADMGRSDKCKYKLKKLVWALGATKPCVIQRLGQAEHFDSCPF